jgi:hypothetical protein
MIRSRRFVWVPVALLLALTGSVTAATWARAARSATWNPIHFATTLSYRTGASPQQVAFADFDGTGPWT